MPSPIIKRFGDEHFTLNSITERRQEQVLAALARLELFLPCPIEQATDQQLRAWLVSLLNSGLSPSTVAFHLKAVRPFYRWCWRTRVISADDMLRLREVRSPRGAGHSVPRPYSRKELKRMWAELDTKFPRLPVVADHAYRSGTYVLQRWRKGTSPYRSVKKHMMRVQLEAIIELALVCGLRRNEIYQLSIDDVHWDNKYIMVHGKRVDQNPRVRDVPYPDSTRKAIREWFRMRGWMGATTDCIWLSVTGPEPTAALSRDRMSMILHSFGDWQLHRLRHTCATERLRAGGMKIEELQRFLGHSNVAQTLRYAQLLRSDIHRAASRGDAGFQAAVRPAA